MKKQKLLTLIAMAGSSLGLALMPMAVPTIILILVILGELSLSTEDLLIVLILAALIDQTLLL
jgi:hypothetical protein